MNTPKPFACLALASALALQGWAKEDLFPILTEDIMEVPANRVVYEHLAKQAYDALDRREERLGEISTPAQFKEYQEDLKKFFVSRIGGFPERTPLHAKVVGKIEGGDHRVEKVIYESQPQHHVTATLYLPKTKPPYPAVLIACGHSKTGKGADYNQFIGITLARNGIAAFCYDPIGQGERSQILPTEGHKLSSVAEHFLIGSGSVLLGTNTARYRIWDGMRGIDYLTSRKDIDGSKIGCTGCSGGGTLTSYIMALDERVGFAAPACYLTTFRQLIGTIGPQDSEQNIFGQIAYGMDQTDYVLMRAPRPTLICCSAGDYFDVQGTWDNFRQSKKYYSLLGEPLAVDLVEDKGKHGITKLQRETLTRLARRWFLGDDSAVKEKPMKPRPVEDLWCTQKGEVLHLVDERTVFDLNRALAKNIFSEERKKFAGLSPEAARKTVREVSTIRLSANLPKLEHHVVETVQENGLQMIRGFFRSKDSYPLASVAYLPANPRKHPVLLLHGTGVKQGHEKALELSKAGHTVVSVEISCTGETRGSKFSEQFGSWKTFYMSYLLGRSLVALRSEDILKLAVSLEGGEIIPKGSKLKVLAINDAAVPALHAMALEPGLFAQLELYNSRSSWIEMLKESQPKRCFEDIVHGALQAYDLPDLERLCRKKLFSEKK
jgi:cephalosporin-C deacetylase-like acetyl esterase